MASSSYYSAFFVWQIYLIGLLFAFLFLILLPTFPLIAIFLADLVVCFSISCLFIGIRNRWIYLLYPPLMLAISFSISGNWFDAGDGLAHTPQAEAVFTEGYWGVTQKIISEYGTMSIPMIAKVMSPGASLGFQIPFFFFNLPAEKLYQNIFILSQGFVYISIIGFIAVLIMQWKIFTHQFAFIFITFLLLSPTAFIGNSAPTRHLITLASVCLLSLSHLAILRRFTFQRLLIYVLSISLVILSKAPLLIPYALFIIISAKHGTRKRVFVLAFLLIFTFILTDTFNYLIVIFKAYDESRVMAMRMIGSGLMDIPFVGWAIKYLYAILSPFPWYKGDEFVENNLSGSYPLFFMQVGSSLTGLYILTLLLKRRRLVIKKFNEDDTLRHFVLFGMIMSTSILAGTTGFHGYLAIFFPFFAPLYLYRELRISMSIPILIAFLANLLAFILDSLLD